jgi:hypothetical protein
MNTIDSATLTNDPSWLLHWQMSNAERCVLPTVLKRLRPELSLEIGTYRGGSLQVLSQHSAHVISLDIDSSVAESLSGRFPNVEFLVGDSVELLPRLVEELNAAGRSVDFVLIDGDHSKDGVRRDIEAVLQLNLRKRMVILMHDGFNPDCRQGMREADWAANPHVHYVELDFTVGNFHSPPVDTATDKSMWGGFACAILEPQHRQHELEIKERQRALFEAVYRISIHAHDTRACLTQRVLRRLRRAGSRIKRTLLSK